MAVRIRDKNALYSAALQHCIENHDVRCGQNILAEGHGSGAYRISNTRWVIEQLAATDPEAARDVFTHVLKLFPKEAGFRDVQILLDAAQAIANTDLELARRAAVALKNAVENPQFESRTPEIVTARFLIDGRQIQTTSTKETVLVQVQSLFERGSFPHLVTATFQMKHPSAVIVHGNNRDPAIDALLRKLSDQVQNLNDFTLEDLNHRTYHLTALRGRPVLLDFWATWCGPCRREMPELDALQRKGLTILAITDEDERVVRKFAAENPHAFLILRDSRGEVFKLYDVGARPTSILINSAGRITARWFELPQRDVVSADLREAGLK
jgi:thiol-disulfide isomerase/thioredoxin